MNLKLFYSHAWADKAGPKVKKLLVLLQKDHDVWLDKKRIDLGNHINDTVEKGIEECDIFVCAWSHNAYDSKGVLFELETATRLNKPILVLKIEDFDTAHSPFLAGKEYIDFSGDEVSYNQQVVYMQNFLLRKKLELFQQHFKESDKKDEVEELAGKTEALQEVLIQLEDTIKRQKMNVSGNDGSDVYVNASLNAFDKTLDPKDESGKLMLQFSACMKEISEKYPLKNDDKTKKRLAIKAIQELDPLATNEYLALLRNQFEQDLGFKKNDTTQHVAVKNEVSQNEESLLSAYRDSINKTKHAELEKLKSVLDDIPFLNIFSSINKATSEFEMSYITNSPEILEKMYASASQSQSTELKILIKILIQHIEVADIERATARKKINEFMPYAYLINNTSRLLVQANVFKQDEISYSLVSSLGLDKLSTLFFKEDWKDKAESFLDQVKNNYGIKDNNLNWLKAAAAIVGVALIADGMDGVLDTGNADSLAAGETANAANGPVYFEDKMAAAGLSMPDPVQY